MVAMDVIVNLLLAIELDLGKNKPGAQAHSLYGLQPPIRSASLGGVEIQVGADPVSVMRLPPVIAKVLESAVDKRPRGEAHRSAGVYFIW